MSSYVPCRAASYAARVVVEFEAYGLEARLSVLMGHSNGITSG
jgi:hypothetical protein